MSRDFTIPCSYGELVDKWTILHIKLEHAQNPDQFNNIKHELELLDKSIIDRNIPLVKDLAEANRKLWNLEDQIRDLSVRRVFNQSYIECAELIHKTNDYRCALKRQLNVLYGSDIQEEKIYGSMNMNMGSHIKEALDYFPHNAMKCYDMLHQLISDNIDNLNSPTGVQLYLNYLTAMYYVGKERHMPNHLPPIDWIISLIDDKVLGDNEYKVQVALHLLHEGRYEVAYRFLPYIHSVTGPYGIGPNNVCSFKPGDKGKTMLVYSSGGLGDIIMFSRFIPLLCNLYSENHIIFMVDSSLLWMFKQAFSDIPNLFIAHFGARLLPFHYHTSILALMEQLNIRWGRAPWSPYLKNVNADGAPLTVSGSFILFGWKGSEANQHEIYNRRVPLEPLLKVLSSASDQSKLVTVQRDITDQEQILLEKYNVLDLSQKCDQGDQSFYDTINLVKQARAVVSSDTSLLHLAGSVRDNGVIGLIVRGCDWRWLDPSWYPKMTIVQQDEYGQWDSVMERLRDHMSSMSDQAN